VIFGQQRNNGAIYSPENSLFPCLLPFHQFSTSSGWTWEFLDSPDNKNNKNTGQSYWTFRLSSPNTAAFFATRILEFLLQTHNKKQG
jgi:hypothetical protein